MCGTSRATLRSASTPASAASDADQSPPRRDAYGALARARRVGPQRSPCEALARAATEVGARLRGAWARARARLGSPAELRRSSGLQEARPHHGVPARLR